MHFSKELIARLSLQKSISLKKKNYLLSSLDPILKEETHAE